MATRDDHVMTISYPDGTTIVEHADGTRITTYYRDSQVAQTDISTDDTGDTGKFTSLHFSSLTLMVLEATQEH